MQTTLQKIYRLSRSISTTLAYISGLLFLLLAIYMTVDVTSRTLGGPFTGISDQLGAFVLALGGTWALSRALIDGSHVRIDVFMPLYSDKVKSAFYIWSMAMVAIFAAVLSKQAWALTMKSWSRNALVPQSMIDIPLAIPQGISALGYTIFMMQALIMLVVAVAMLMGGQGDIQETLETHEIGDKA